jgi:hypothetical protein
MVMDTFSRDWAPSVDQHPSFADFLARRTAKMAKASRVILPPVDKPMPFAEYLARRKEAEVAASQYAFLYAGPESDYERGFLEPDPSEDTRDWSEQTRDTSKNPFTRLLAWVFKSHPLFGGYPPGEPQPPPEEPTDRPPMSGEIPRGTLNSVEGPMDFRTAGYQSQTPFWLSYFGVVALLIGIMVVFLGLFEPQPASALMTAPDPVPLQSLAVSPATSNVVG